MDLKENSEDNIMTLKQLINKLQDIDKENPGKRLKVAIDTKEAKSKYNDVFDVVDVSDFRIDCIEIADGDGFSTGRYQEFLLLS